VDRNSLSGPWRISMFTIDLVGNTTRTCTLHNPVPGLVFFPLYDFYINFV
jgi:hypothetical protein